MRFLFVIANAALVIGFAVPALADPAPLVPDDPAADSAFLDSLNKAGMKYSNGPSAVAAGRMACNLMNEGTSESDVVSKLSMLNPGLGAGGAMKFAALASSTYCPDYLSKGSTKPSSQSPGMGGMFGGFGR